MNWLYESDGEAHNKTHYIIAENLEGTTLKETFLRIDCVSRKQAIRLIKEIGKLTYKELKIEGYIKWKPKNKFWQNWKQ